MMGYTDPLKAQKISPAKGGFNDAVFKLCVMFAGSFPVECRTT